MAPKTMRAAQIDSKNGPSSLKIVELPVPVPDSGQVLVRVASSSCNPVECLVAAGKIGGDQAVLPKTLAGDCAGWVESTDGKKFKKGDKIFCMEKSFAPSIKEGAWAEYMAVKEEYAALAPSKISLSKVTGAVPLAALTAFQALEKADPQPGQRCLVHAGAGGVGTWVVQLAKVHYKMFVVATAGPKNQQFLTDLGADEALDYTSQDFSKVYAEKPFHCIIDMLGDRNDTETRSYSVLAEGGTFSHIWNPTHTDEERHKSRPEVWTKGRKWVQTIVEPNAVQLEKLAEYLDSGAMQQPVAAVYPLERAREALEEVAKGHTRGKVVIEVSSS